MTITRRVLILAAMLSIVGPAAVDNLSVAAQDSSMAGMAMPGMEQQRQIEITILGMSCPFCAYGVEQKLKRIEGVEGLEVVLETGVATLTLADDADVANDEIIEKVQHAGFEVDRIVRNFDSDYSMFERETDE